MSQKDRSKMSKLKGSSFSDFAAIQNDKLLKPSPQEEARRLRAQKKQYIQQAKVNQLKKEVTYLKYKQPIDLASKGLKSIELAGKALGKLGIAAFKAGQANRNQRLGLNTSKVSSSAVLREEVKVLELERRRAKLLQEKEKYKGYY
jgi:hypothetical protein